MADLPRRFLTGNPDVDRAIDALVAFCPDQFDRRLLAEMVTTIVKLGEENETTGDMKLVNTALKELRYAFKVFMPYRDVRKVAVFGSARTQPSAPSYRLARTFAQLMVESGWMLITGAASGIMQAGNEGAGREASFGVNIRLPFEQEANPIIADDPKLINFKYFFTRKLMFIKESSATVLFPGGFGTIDEGYECLTLVQTGKADPRPIVFVDVPGQGFWDRLSEFMDRLVADGMIAPEDQSLLTIVESAEAARDEILRFYHNYHSLRFVDDQLVIRLQRPVPPDTLAALSTSFADIIEQGTLKSSGPLPGERGDEALAHLPRVVFHFKRQSFGRLRELIDQFNLVP